MSKLKYFVLFLSIFSPIRFSEKAFSGSLRLLLKHSYILLLLSFQVYADDDEFEINYHADEPTAKAACDAIPNKSPNKSCDDLALFGVFSTVCPSGFSLGRYDAVVYEPIENSPNFKTIHHRNHFCYKIYQNEIITRYYADEPSAKAACNAIPNKSQFSSCEIPVILGVYPTVCPSGRLLRYEVVASEPVKFYPYRTLHYRNNYCEVPKTCPDNQEVNPESGQCYSPQEVISVKEHQKDSRGCSASGNPTPTTGNPIIIATGNKYQQETDYQSQKPFGLSFTRSFNSTAYDVDTDIGIKWHHNFARHIDSSNARALVRRSNGQAFVFNNVAGSWQADVDVSDTLVERLDENNQRLGWLYTTDNDNVEQYNALGQLIQVTNRAGQTQTFLYTLTTVDGGDDNDLTLDKITGFTGDSLQLFYDTQLRISRMTNPEGHHTLYSYDAQGNLSRVSYPDETINDTSDNPTRLYHYEHPTFTHHLTGITDETGQRYVTWNYDAQGRGILSESTGDTGRSTVLYHEDNSATVTNALGKQTTYHFVTLHQVKKLTQVTGHATENCGGANKTYTYDQYGYLQSKTDWQGNLTTYSYDTKGRQLRRTEAAGTPEAKTIFTQWYLNFRLPSKVTQEGQVTEYTYDTQGRLLTQTTRKIQ